jgi:hypothetical protein
MVLAAGAATAAAKPSPKAVFNARVRAVGTEAQTAILAMPTQASPSAAESAAAVAQLQAVYQRVAQRLAALTPPLAIKRDFKILVAAYRADVKYAGAWHDALLHGTAHDAADASSALYNSPETYHASLALVRMSQKGYYFGTFFR